MEKIVFVIFTSDKSRKLPIEESQVKMYLLDTFNIAFGYPRQQPWTLGDLECRLESIRELLSSRDVEMAATDTIFRDVVSTYHPTTTNRTPTTTSASHDVFEKAANAFQQAKAAFTKINSSHSWSDGGCIWLDNAQASLNERRHDDILTYDHRDGRQLSTYSFIITCFVVLTDDGNCITLSVGSVSNGKTIRIPIGYYSKAQDFARDFESSFPNELNRLIIAIAKERRTIVH